MSVSKRTLSRAALLGLGFGALSFSPAFAEELEVPTDPNTAFSGEAFVEDLTADTAVVSETSHNVETIDPPAAIQAPAPAAEVPEAIVDPVSPPEAIQVPEEQTFDTTVADIPVNYDIVVSDQGVTTDTVDPATQAPAPVVESPKVVAVTATETTKTNGKGSKKPAPVVEAPITNPHPDGHDTGSGVPGPGNEDTLATMSLTAHDHDSPEDADQAPEEEVVEGWKPDTSPDNPAWWSLYNSREPLYLGENTPQLSVEQKDGFGTVTFDTSKVPLAEGDTLLLYVEDLQTTEFWPVYRVTSPIFTLEYGTAKDMNTNVEFMFVIEHDDGRHSHIWDAYQQLIIYHAGFEHDDGDQPSLNEDNVNEYFEADLVVDTVAGTVTVNPIKSDLPDGWTAVVESFVWSYENGSELRAPGAQQLGAESVVVLYEGDKMAEIWYRVVLVHDDGTKLVYADWNDLLVNLPGGNPGDGDGGGSDPDPDPDPVNPGDGDGGGSDPDPYPDPVNPGDGDGGGSDPDPDPDPVNPGDGDGGGSGSGSGGNTGGGDSPVVVDKGDTPVSNDKPVTQPVAPKDQAYRVWAKEVVEQFEQDQLPSVSSVLDLPASPEVDPASSKIHFYGAPVLAEDESLAADHLGTINHGLGLDSGVESENVIRPASLYAGIGIAGLLVLCAVGVATLIRRRRDN